MSRTVLELSTYLLLCLRHGTRDLLQLSRDMRRRIPAFFQFDARIAGARPAGNRSDSWISHNVHPKRNKHAFSHDRADGFPLSGDLGHGDSG